MINLVLKYQGDMEIVPVPLERGKSMPDKIKIHGISLDDQGRCLHYHKNCDVVALKCAECHKYYACFSCHDELEEHAFAATGTEETHPVMCGNCHRLLTREQYGEGSCPYCGIDFNPRCKLHAHIYFK